MEQNRLSERIKSLRKEKGVSQTIMAKEVGVSYSQYSRYEARDAQPPAETLKRIADYLDTSVDFLLYGDTNQKAQETLKDTELIKHFKEVEALPENEKYTVLKFLGAYLRDFKAKQAYAS